MSAQRYGIHPLTVWVDRLDEDVDTGLYPLRLDRGVPLVLQGTAGIIWQALSLLVGRSAGEPGHGGSASADDVAELIARELQLDAAQILPDAERALEELADLGLLERRD